MDFERAVKHVLEYEGGLVDHPKDPGGVTKYGISLRAYPHLGADGIRNLTVEQAKAIYKKDYWDATKCSEIPSGMRLMLFDCAVNQGVGYATKAFQTSVSAKPDGAIGPRTLAAARSADEERAVQKFAFARYSRYSNNRNFNVFGMGWMRRLLAVTAITLT